MKNGLIEKDGPKQILEVLVAPGPDLNLVDRTKKSYIESFDGLNELFEKYNIEQVILAFFPKGSNAHMISDNLRKRQRAEDYLKSCVDIGKHISAKRVVGPSVVEHKNLDEPYNILNIN